MFIKNKKSIKHIVFTVLVAVTTATASADLLAEDTAEPLESEVSISFEKGNADVDPLDPVNPTLPQVEDPLTPGGSLSLNHVSDFTFGQQDISAYNRVYPTLSDKPYIQVTDLRGSGEGWEVTARGSLFVNNGNYSMLGSSIVLSGGECISPVKDLVPPQPVDPVTILMDGQNLAKIVTAANMEGIGTWLTRWFNAGSVQSPNSYVELNVPGGTGLAGNNTAKITWYVGTPVV